MNQTGNMEREHDTSASEGGSAMIDLLIALAKHKKTILSVTIGTAILSVAVSMALPNVYKASTKLLPPQQSQSSAAALLSQLGGIAGAAAGAAGVKSPSELYVSMLKSRTVADRLIAQFSLKKAYDTDSQEKARKLLEANTSITSGKDGLLVIEFEDTDKKLVAPLTNAYAGELFRLMKTMAVTDASQRRLFYERQLETAKDNLAKAEMALKSGLDTRGVISVDTESKGIVETIARLKAQVSAKEIQLASMRAFLTPANPEYHRVEEELGGIRAELSKLENGRDAVSGASETQGGLENIKLLRDLKYQQMLYEAIAKQFEVARLDEAKDPSIVQVLDPAVEPEIKSRPKRSLIILMATLVAAISVICWALVVEAKKKALRSPENEAKWAEFKSYLGYARKR